MAAGHIEDAGRWYVDGAGVSRFLAAVRSGTPSFVEQALGSSPGAAATEWSAPSVSSWVSFMDSMISVCGVSKATPTGATFTNSLPFSMYTLYGDHSSDERSMYVESRVMLSHAMVLVDWNFPATPPDSWVWPKPAT